MCLLHDYPALAELAIADFSFFVYNICRVCTQVMLM